MAVVKLSGLLSGVAGKINGSQFNNSSSGLILQRKCQQKAVGSANQLQWRQNFKFAANYWKSLTPAEQEANNASALNYPYTDRFGDTRYYNGYQLLLRSNCNLLNSGLSLINEVPSTPPTSGSYTSTSGIAYIPPISNLTLYVNWSVSPAISSNSKTNIFLSPVVSAGVSNYTGKYALAGTFNSNDEEAFFNPWDIPYYSSWYAGGKIFIQLQAINIATGVLVAQINFSLNVTS